MNLLRYTVAGALLITILFFIMLLGADDITFAGVFFLILLANLFLLFITLALSYLPWFANKVYLLWIPSLLPVLLGVIILLKTIYSILV